MYNDFVAYLPMRITQFDSLLSSLLSKLTSCCHLDLLPSYDLMTVHNCDLMIIIRPIHTNASYQKSKSFTQGPFLYLPMLFNIHQTWFQFAMISWKVMFPSHRCMMERWHTLRKGIVLASLLFLDWSNSRRYPPSWTILSVNFFSTF